MGGEGGASRTAVLVCQGRAAAHDRLAAGRFDDPTARLLLRPAEREAVDLVRTGAAPHGVGRWVEYEMVRACGEVMAARTVVIDDAIREAVQAARETDPAAAAQLVVLGAGLDGRAWRMPELAAVTVFEVDHPATQRDKRDRAAGLDPPVAPVRFVPVDFSRDDLGAALAAAGHLPTAPTVWVWEGVVPYLTAGQVRATTRTVADRSAPGSRLAVHYHEPAVLPIVGRLLARVTAALGRRPNPMAREPYRSAWTPAVMRRMLAGHGFAVHRDDDLLTSAEALGIPVDHRRSLRNGRVAVADHAWTPAPACGAGADGAPP